MTLDDALAALRAEANPQEAAKSPANALREVLGLRVARITELATQWRQGLSIEARVALASGLWDSNIHDARIAAAKLLVQARISPDAGVWDLICSWGPELDDDQITAIVADAGARRLTADPSRLDAIEPWLTQGTDYQKGAAILMTQPWAVMNNLKPADLAIRDRLMGWAAILAADPSQRAIKSLGYWLKDLAKHDAARVHAFLIGPGAGVKGFGFMADLRNPPLAKTPKEKKLPPAVEPLGNDDDEDELPLESGYFDDVDAEAEAELAAEDDDQDTDR